MTAAVVAIFMAHTALAQPEAVEQFKDYLPAQIQGLTDEQRQRVPIMFLQAANLASAPFGGLVIESQLNELMYDGVGDYDGAKRAFQADLGAEPTGLLTVSQIHELGYRADRRRLGSVSFFPLRFGGTMTDDFAHVEGTVTILEERIAYPVNHVKVDCWKSDNLCRYQQFVLTVPDRNSWTQSYGVMELVDEYYRITRWENQQIDAVPMEASACRINQLNLNFATKEFYEIARNNTSEACGPGGAFEPLKKPRVSQIVDGDDIISTEFNAIAKEVYGYLASSYRERVKPFEQASSEAEAEASKH